MSQSGYAGAGSEHSPVLPTAPARKAVSAGKMTLVVMLLVTGAAAIKFGAWISRSKEFHPNWAARSSESKPSDLIGD